MGYAIIMRHGERNNEHDSPLVTLIDKRSPEECCPEIWDTLKYITTYNIEKIITSPYLRTRQTAFVVQYGYYKLTGKLLPILIDKRIGEYLTKQCRWGQPERSEFDKETLRIYNNKIPLCKESKELMLNRVIDFYKDIEDKTLVITHKSIANVLGILSGKDVDLDIAQFDIIKLKNKENVNLYD